MVGTAQGRLCPPDEFEFKQSITVIASAAKQSMARQAERWISSLRSQ